MAVQPQDENMAVTTLVSSLAFHTMVTLCGRMVVLFGGADEAIPGDMNKVVIAPNCKNEAWIFDINRNGVSCLSLQVSAASTVLAVNTQQL